MMTDGCWRGPTLQQATKLYSAQLLRMMGPRQKSPAGGSKPAPAAQQTAKLQRHTSNHAQRVHSSYQLSRPSGGAMSKTSGGHPAGQASWIQRQRPPSLPTGGVGHPPPTPPSPRKGCSPGKGYSQQG
jgi:hypothetical protein